MEPPDSLEEAMRAPYAIFWGDGLADVRAYASDPSLAATSVEALLRTRLGGDEVRRT